MSDKIYEMKLHEEIEIKPGFRIVCVPGGWIYCLFDGESRNTSTFVPFTNEYKEQEE